MGGVVFCEEHPQPDRALEQKSVSNPRTRRFKCGVREPRLLQREFRRRPAGHSADADWRTSTLPLRLSMRVQRLTDQPPSGWSAAVPAAALNVGAANFLT